MGHHVAESFDSIPHAELMKSVARRVSDRHLLHLLKMWLEAPVEETDEHGRVQRTTPQQGRRSRHAARRRGLTVIGESVYAAVFGGLEAAGARAAVGGTHRQLCRRLRHLLPAGSGRRGHDGNAADDGEAEADGKRAKDAAMLRTGRDVHLSGLHVWPAGILEDGTSVCSS